MKCNRKGPTIIKLVVILIALITFSGCVYWEVNGKAYGIVPKPTLGSKNRVGTMHESGAGMIIASENLLDDVDEIGEEFSRQNKELFEQFSFGDDYVIKDQTIAGLKNVQSFVNKQANYLIKSLPLIVEELGHEPPKVLKKINVRVLPSKDRVAEIDRTKNTIIISHGFVARLYVAATSSAFNSSVDEGHADSSPISTLLTAKEAFKIYQDSLRFVIAHEAAHLMFHEKPNSVDVGIENEISADIFASYFLFSEKIRSPTLVPWGKKNALEILNIVYKDTSFIEGGLFHLSAEQRKRQFESEFEALDNEHLEESDLWGLVLGKNLKMGVVK